MDEKTRKQIVLVFGLVNAACVLLICLGIFIYLFFFNSPGPVP